MRKTLLYILPILLGFSACNESIGPDPCANFKPFTANFGIREYVSKTEWPNWVDYYTDTVSDQIPLLYVKSFYDSSDHVFYRWEFENRIITKQGFYIDLRDEKPDKKVFKIKLTIINNKKEPCNTQEKDTLSFTKNLVVYPRWQTKLNGNYIPTDSVNMPDGVYTVYMKENSTYCDSSGILFKDFKTQKFFYNKSIILIGYKEMVDDDSALGFILKPDNNTIQSIGNVVDREKNKITYISKRR